MVKRFTLTREELLDNSFVVLDDVRLEWSRDIYSDEYKFTLTLPDPKPVEKWPQGVAECYGCAREFKWIGTPGALPMCDNCTRWIDG